MAFQFPASPFVGQVFTPTPGVSYRSHGVGWVPFSTQLLTVADADARYLFPSGTHMIFQQTSAPTGWTKITSVDDTALRVVNGTAGSGGSAGFSGFFGP